jgi:WD40 repeat protein
VSASLASPIYAPWILRPIAAVTISLAAVSAFTAVLGIAFLPAEIQPVRRLISVTHSVELTNRAVVTLFWSMPSGYGGGRKHHLALQRVGSADPHCSWTAFEPLSLAKGPGQDQVLVGALDGSIHLLDIAHSTTELVRADHHRGGVIALACSADGQCLVSQGFADLRAWDMVTQRERWRRADVAPFGFVLSPNAQTAFIADQLGEAFEIDLQSGRTLRSLTRFDGTILQIALSPDGNHLAILSGSGRLLMLDIHTGGLLWEQPMLFPAHQAPARVVAFSTSGRQLVTSNPKQGSALILWDAATGQRLRELRGHQRIVHGAEFATSGEIRSWAADGTIRLWDPTTGATLSTAALQAPLNAT